MKKMLVILGIIGVIIIAGLIVLFTSLDRIVAAAIERLGSMTTQTDVKVSAVTLKMQSGEGSVKGIHIGNPSGFSTSDAFTLGDISIKIDTSTVTKDVVVIDQILISKPHITYEINDSGQSNIDVINQNIKQLQGKSTPEAAKEKEKDWATVKLLIRKLEIEGSQVDVHIPVKPEPLTVKMPRIELANLGSGGEPPREIAARILSELVKKVGPAVAQVGVEKYLGKSVEEMKGQIQKQIDEKAGETVEGLSGEAGNAVKKFLGQ
jgi:hypothetical protein